MTKEEFEEIIKPLYLLNGKDCQFIRTALLGNFDKWSETKQCNIANVVGRSKQLICHHCNKYKRLQRNGMIHQLCECGEQAN